MTDYTSLSTVYRMPLVCKHNMLQTTHHRIKFLIKYKYLMCVGGAQQLLHITFTGAFALVS